VSAEVTLRPFARTALRASAFRSRSDATNALDSIYRMLVGLVCGVVCAAGEGRAPALRLRFATVSVDQRRSGSRSERNIRPVLGRIAGFEWRPDHAGRDELVEATRHPG